MSQEFEPVDVSGITASDFKMDPNISGLYELADSGRLPSDRFVAFVDGSLVASGDDFEAVVDDAIRFRSQNGISEAATVFDRQFPDETDLG